MVYPAYYTVDTRGKFCRGKADHSPSFSAEVNEWSRYMWSPHMSLWHAQEHLYFLHMYVSIMYVIILDILVVPAIKRGYKHFIQGFW